MNRIRLLHLTMVGAGVESASIDFDPKLTVVYGSSETGKSYIAGVLDFMLGGGRLPKDIVESDGYTHALLGITLSDETPLTLVRSVKGGKIRGYRSDIRTLPSTSPELMLSPKHKDGSLENLSNFLLSEIGLAGRRLKKNQDNETISLSFRLLSPLIIVNETDVQAERSPILTGQYTTKTIERSVFKLLLEGDDDSELIADPPADEKSLNKGRVEVIERILTDLRSSLTSTSEKSELLSQLERLNGSIDRETQLSTVVTQRRDLILSQRSRVIGRIESIQRRISEINDLSGRFKLLQEQYSSDLSRLEMVGEVGTFLGYFTPGTCVFCGAEVEHQNPQIHTLEETTDIAESVIAETRRTQALSVDLANTIDNLDHEGSTETSELQHIQFEASELDSELARLDNELNPYNSQLRELLDLRSSIEQQISFHDQMDRLRLMLTSYSKEEPKQIASADESPKFSALQELSSIIQSLLVTWGITDSSPVQYDRKTDDLIVGNRPRISRGKGMRSLIHAAFNLALAQYCFDRNMEHPGFVILDSPLVTYREPYGAPQGSDIADEAISGHVADKFFRNLANEFNGQLIIFENVDPPADIKEKATCIYFTKNSEGGRYGFFPLR